MGDLEVAVGDVVTLAPDAEDEEQQLDGSEVAGGPPLGLVQALWQSSSGAAARPAPARLVLAISRCGTRILNNS